MSSTQTDVDNEFISQGPSPSLSLPQRVHKRWQHLEQSSKISDTGSSDYHSDQSNHEVNFVSSTHPSNYKTVSRMSISSTQTDIEESAHSSNYRTLSRMSVSSTQTDVEEFSPKKLVSSTQTDEGLAVQTDSESERVAQNFYITSQKINVKAPLHCSKEFSG